MTAALQTSVNKLRRAIRELVESEVNYSWRGPWPPEYGQDLKEMLLKKRRRVNELLRDIGASSEGV